MEVWRPSYKYSLITREFGVTDLEDLCFKYNYCQPCVGYCIVPLNVWCRKFGKFASYFVLRSHDTSHKNNFGVITSFTSYGNTVSEAVSKLVESAYDFIAWRAEALNKYG
nr:nonstructural protein [Human coronavirus HKU1]